MSESSFPTMPLDRLLKINEVCNRFERELAANDALPVDEFLTDVIESDRAILRAELEAIQNSRRAETATQPPAEIGAYIIEEEVGRGGMGQVHRAVHRTMKRRVAIKLLHVPESAQQAAADQRFQREVEILSQLQHPNVVSAFDAGRDGAWRYLVTELIDGIDLARWVKANGPMSVPQAIDVVEQICLGLEYLHGRGIVHRDLKPANVMLDKSGRARILDVGVARALTETASGTLTQPGWIVGSVDYMAPEQAGGAHQADFRSDLYGLGCTLYFLLMGRKPFQGKTPIEVLIAHRDQPFPPLGDMMPADLIRLVKDLVSKEAKDRPSSASVVLARLRALRAAANGPKRATAPGSVSAARWVLPLAASVGCALLLIVAMASVAGLWWLVPDRPPVAPVLADLPLAEAEAYQKQWATHMNLPVSVTDDTGLAFVFVPPGRFHMGTSDNDLKALLAVEHDDDKCEKLRAETARPMEIAKPFYLGATEVTIGQFRRFVDATRRETQAEKIAGAWGIEDGKWTRKKGFSWKNLGEQPAADEIPVFNITCDEAEAFCHWLNGISKTGARYRLPVEAEWEYACRAGSVTPFCGGDHTTLQRYAWFADNAKMRISPVGQKQPNAFGLFDMHGNHAEWCGIAERGSPLFTPIPGDQASDRASRGGHFFESADRLRSAARDWGPAGSMGKGGFRVLKEIRE